MKSSVLLDLCNGPLAEATNIDDAKFLCKEAINSCTHTVDKRKMLYELDRCKTLAKVQQYMVNAMLKYQGMGTIKPKRW